MTRPSAKIILDSISEKGDRLTTMEVVFHRFVLAEFNTHRVFSRNSASSRAIPVEKQLTRYIDDPAIPLELPAEQPGMQGGSSLEGQDYIDAQILIDSIHSFTGNMVMTYLKDHPNKSNRLHKSVLNRYLEPFMWHTVIVTSTEYENFFKQRCSPLAQPEIRAVAEEMERVYRESTPELIMAGEWHTPYILDDEYFLDQDELKRLSAARCARVSYLTHDGKRDITEDFKLFERLASADPGHWSPLEHVATPYSPGLVRRLSSPNKGNLKGWRQMRHDFEGK